MASPSCVAYLALLIACLLPLLCQCQSGEPCPSFLDKPSCVCNHPDGLGIVDATSLGSEAPDAPKFVAISKLESQSFLFLASFLCCTVYPFHRFKGIIDPEGYKYTFNPCHFYSEKLCTNVHVCVQLRTIYIVSQY